MALNPLIDASISNLDKDDWHCITDAKKRKKIQDRLAQRARRNRLREAKKNSQQTSRTPQKQPDEYNNYGSAGALQLGCGDSFDLLPHSAKLTRPSVLYRSPLARCSPIEQIPSMTYEFRPSMTVFSAMYINGTILGLSCCTVVPAKSQPASPDVPLALQPTSLQLTVLHQPGVDRFPFPTMRDNLINLHAMIDEEEFTRDICTMPSFTITTGLAPWDPKAWKVEKYFADKWGYLFY